MYAQETSGAIRGQITDESGAPVANATVVIRHEPTGGEITTVTNAGGMLKLLNLGKRVQDLLQITKLYTVFETFDDEAAAIRSFA